MRGWLAEAIVVVFIVHDVLKITIEKLVQLVQERPSVPLGPVLPHGTQARSAQMLQLLNVQRSRPIS
ncbi:hypothetical protein K525DRAFT_257355 [Schizophyllum commune Loenen D]|nr:hypothetical protein K525DRAFT_257355 [Schizophyllum commune Loenen D]